MIPSSQSVGTLGESIACTYLQRKGYAIVERNFQNTKGYKYGEIDIIALQGEIIIFVEVKTRIARSSDTVLPEENISPQKLRHLEKIASTYLTIKKLWKKEYRFDALSILIDPHTKNAKVRHLEHIFF
ncbi:MAG: YraN family protein [Candidatus Moranbacteria bacterium]|nr:YraN family protein [Candidatus Moranbacteria bacterium]